MEDEIKEPFIDKQNAADAEPAEDCEKQSQLDKEWNTIQHKRRDKHEKLNRLKARKNRELGDLEANQVFASQLRSSSGKLYSASVTLNTNQTTVEHDNQHLTTVKEGEADSADEQEVEMPTCTEPECKNFASLAAMISKLQKSVDRFMNETNRQRLVNADVEEDIKLLQDTCKENADEIDAMGDDIDAMKHQLKVVSNIVIKQDQQIVALNKKVTELQQRDMNPNVVISGMTEKPNERPLLVFNNFVADKLEIQELVPAAQAFRVGNGTNRPLIVQLRDPLNYKPKLFASASKLRGKRNENGKSFFISDHLPEELHDQRRRVNELVSANKKKPVAHQQNLEVKRGVLRVNGTVYEKQVEAPSAASQIRPPEKLRKLACEIDVVKGITKTACGSTFTALAVAVENFDDVNAAYLKVRMKFSDATHVAFAYRLPGSDQHIKQDYVNDGEHGAGRVLLGVLKEQQLMNLAVFLIRYYGGKHLGAARFDVFKQVAISAVEALMKKRSQESSQPPVEPLPDNLRDITTWTTPQPSETPDPS